jgi:hypothetical protein
MKSARDEMVGIGISLIVLYLTLAGLQNWLYLLFGVNVLTATSPMWVVLLITLVGNVLLGLFVRMMAKSKNDAALKKLGATTKDDDK